jgi:hypothetical protein
VLYGPRTVVYGFSTFPFGVIFRLTLLFSRRISFFNLYEVWFFGVDILSAFFFFLGVKDGTFESRVLNFRTIF